ncbi:L-rhamnose/proton symporter RhaT, partial [bacterium]|nr:L-rhamnose/proton symporter RhaT [bacterium]
MNPILGVALIAIGSLGAASFYIPFKKVKEWAWESYWISQGVAAWLIAPWVFALLTVPNGSLMDILSDAPVSAKWLAMMFGALWGIGGLTFGLSIRYLGIALGQSVALGFTAAFGTLIPPIVARENLFGTTSGILIVVGVAICIAGIVVIGYAGALKTRNMSEEKRKEAVKEFALKKGLLIAVFAGIMSACMNYGFKAGVPIAEVAMQYGTNSLYQNNPSLIFILLGGFFTNVIYCVYLNIKNKTGKDYIKGGPGLLLNNIGFTFLAGLLWFLQFHFYGMGTSLLPAAMSIFGWSILMALNIAFSNIWGIILKEWKGAGRKTMVVLVIGIIVLILSTFVV